MTFKKKKQNLNTDRLQMWSCVPTPKTVAGIVKALNKYLLINRKSP